MADLFVLGAGTDKHLGLPLANELVPALATYTGPDGPGAKIDEILRKKLKNLRFQFSKFVDDSVDRFLEDQLTNPSLRADFLQQIQDRNPEEESPNLNFLIAISRRIAEIRRQNFIDDEFAEKIHEVIESEVKDDNLIQLRGIQLTSDPYSAIKKILYSSVYRDDTQNPADHELQKYILNSIFPFEKLLMEHFSGFYTHKGPDIKKYLYMAWVLWAYLRHYMADKSEAALDSPFYQQINKINARIITFNYTSFFSDEKISEVSFFHGDCFSYLRYRDRKRITPSENDLVYHASDPENIYRLIDSLTFDIDDMNFPMPAIVPPLAFKPVISSEFLRQWADANDELGSCERIIIIGYSFAQADEHFNDIFRRNAKTKPVTIINPDLKASARTVAQVLGKAFEFEEGVIQGHPALVFDNVRVIGAPAEAVDLNQL